MRENFIFNKMSKKVEVSVVIPLYGEFDLDRVVLSVNSIFLQKNIECEVIVSEQGEFPKFPKISNVKYTFKYHKPRSDLSDFNPGNVRNEAIFLANGEFIYTNDADIIFLNNDYLAKCVNYLKENSNKVLYRPFMRRLPLDEFDKFKKMIYEEGFKKTLDSIDLSQNYIATLNKELRKIRTFEKKSVYPKTFVAFEDDFQRYINNKNNLGKEPMFWNENRHCGANLFCIDKFVSVGGYSEDFINWGCEDSDLQWKFSEIYDLEFFPKTFEVLHLDHPKGYFSQKMWANNEETIKKRKKNGLRKTIEEDKNKEIWKRFELKYYR